MSESGGDVRNDIRINSRINFYGPVIMIGTISFSSVGLFFFVLWAATHWAQAVLMSSILVYGLFGLLGIAVVALVVCLIIKVVVHPAISAKERNIEANAQEWRNRLLYADSHFAIVVDADGDPVVHPVFPAPPPAKIDPRSEKDVVLEFHMANMGHKKIAEATGWTEYQVRQVCDEFDKKFGYANANKLRKSQSTSRENQLALSENYAASSENQSGG